jgi:hypothetical protein
MGPTFAATAFSLLAIAAAFFIRPRVVKNVTILRGALFWLVSVPVLFLIPYNMLSLVTCGVLAFALAPKDKADRLTYYLVIFPAVPATIDAAIPFPGINYLLNLDFAKVTFLVVVAAAFFSGKRPNAARYVGSVGVFIILLSLLIMFMQFRDNNLTNGLRLAFNYALLYALPYLGLVRLFEDTEDLDRVFSSFLFLAAIFFFTAVVTQLTSWNIYAFLEERQGIPVFADYRYGILRTNVTVIPLLMGLVSGFGLIALEYFRSRRRLSLLAAWAFRLFFLAAAFFTFARGAWLAIGAGLFTYFFFTKVPRGLRPALLVMTLLIGAPAVIYYALTADFGAVDSFGTFAYRQELLKATFIHVQQYPLFGAANIYELPHFQHLYQGQGIIDFVNYYVQIVVEYGMVGLFLFVAPWLVVLVGILDLPKKDKSIIGTPDETRRAALLAVIASYLVAIATVSAVSYVAHFGVAILALSAGFLGAARARQALAAAPAPIAGAPTDAGVRAGDLNAA